MALKHTPDGKTSRTVLRAAASAILKLETVTGSFASHDVTRDDCVAIEGAVRSLWSVLETNGIPPTSTWTRSAFGWSRLGMPTWSFCSPPNIEAKSSEHYT